MAKIELKFVVDKVMNAQNPADQYVSAVQVIDYSLPYRFGALNLPVIDDGALKQFGPGQQWTVTIEF